MLRHLTALTTIPAIIEKMLFRNKSHVYHFPAYHVRIDFGISIRFTVQFVDSWAIELCDGGLKFCYKKSSPWVLKGNFRLNFNAKKLTTTLYGSGINWLG
jgi:hypothetical protein